MKNKLVRDIDNYITYLNSCGYYVTVHGQGISGLLAHNIHNNPLCTLVKTDSCAWTKCVREQKKVFSKCGVEYFFGMCYAGLEEYVFFANDNTFVSVSGYGIHREKALPRINRLAEEFRFDRRELWRVYDEGLRHTAEDEEKLCAIIMPLCHMLNMLQGYLSAARLPDGNGTLFDAIFGFVQLHFMEDITINDIAHACACSTSAVSHLFSENMGQSVKSYITHLRIEQAKKLLTTSYLPIGSIASLCGFANINYFPSVFKKYTGCTPGAYRKR